LYKLVPIKETSFFPVALDYAKSMRCVLDYPPHLEHIDDEMWAKLAEMCLNVVLGDSLRKRLADEADVETEEISRADLSPESDEDEDDSITSTETKKRRRRWESGPSEPSMSTRSAVPRGQPGPVSAEQIEFGSLLALLTSSSPLFLPSITQTWAPPC
jgi:ataxia telangiectasia mutated family protein